MRLLKTLALLILLTLPAQGAVTVASRGTNGNASAGASITITPTSNLAAGSMAVLVVAVDNLGSGGNTPCTPATETDSVGNVYTRRLNPIYDPGAAAAGVEMAIYTAQLTTALATSDNLVFNFVTVSPVAKTWTLTEIIPGAGLQMTFLSGACGAVCGSATATPTVTTVSITSGDAVVGAGGAESTLTWTGDADTSNGSWTNEQEFGVTGMSITTQAKVVTGTATQTYNPTLTSADTFVAYIVLDEVPIPTGMGRRVIRM